MSELKLPAASGGGSISIKGPASSGSDVDLLDTSGNLKLSDSDELRLGTGDDLKIYHNGTNSLIKNSTGALELQADNFAVYDYSANELQIKATANGAVELYHNNVKTLETTSWGVDVVGILRADELKLQGDNHKLYLGAGSDIAIYFDGTDGHIKQPAGTMWTESASWVITSANGGENIARFDQNGACKFYYDNGLKAETISTGVNITGGIRLGGNNAANEMDDYEEGTFTPRMGGVSNIGSYNVTGVGQYIKIGGICHFNLHFYNKDLDNSASGGIMIDQLPFTSTNENSMVAGITTDFHTEKIVFDETKRYSFYCSGNTTQWKGLYSVSNSGWSSWSVDDWENAAIYFELAGSYRTA